MQILACDSITIIDSVNNQVNCVGMQIIEYIPPTTANEIDPVYLLELCSIGFSFVAGLLLLPNLFKWVVKELFDVLDTYSK